MHRIFLRLFILINLLPNGGYGQAMDRTLYTGFTGSDRQFSLRYENDLFTGTDRYYTQGVTVEAVASWLRRFPLQRLLVRPRHWHCRYGVALESDAYTPSTILKDEPLYGDRPYAAAVFLETFVVAIDTARQAALTTTLTTGIIGPAAGGYEMQRDIHRWTNNQIPLGWEYQIGNDAVLNYALQYEKRLLAIGSWFQASGLIGLRAGTLSAKAGAGLFLVAGRFPRFPGSGKPVAVQCYGYFQPMAQAVGYDATLQGGLLNRDSPNTVAAKEVERLVYSHRYGLVLAWHRYLLSYGGQFTTKEFRTGTRHQTGSLSMSIGF